MLLYVDTGYQYEIGERGGDGDEKGQFIHAVIESRKSRRVDGRIEGKDGEVMVLEWSPLEGSATVNNGWRNRGLDRVVKDGWFLP
ncbi:hypothetical protein E1A91_D13G123300v1 [Gossypium mustelinum]|uniref:Uncharacterized protein n=4 Tax=Gossypium TaxID=3633 RepID=A0A5D2S3K2_GOSMU|nr:hypothetical protein E1A91_D13G123300v1 [Gossypium mustelinum]